MIKLYYDLESDSEHAAYANMSLMGILEVVENYEPIIWIWEAPFTEQKLQEIKDVLCDPNCMRIGFNNLNYDDIVLANYGITVPEENTHDAMLALKTVFPELPSFALKFNCWWFLNDYHWPEFKMLQKGHKWEGGEVSDELRKYHRHDLEQHRMIWEYVEPFVIRDLHWDAYCLDMGMKFPLQEMTYEGGTYVDVPKCESTLVDLLQKKEMIQSEMNRLTAGSVKNANSNKQVGKYLAQIESFALSLTGTGEFQLKKKDLLEMIGMSDEEVREWKVGDKLPEGISEVAFISWWMRENETVRKYVKNYHTAALGTSRDGWIPNAYGISRAATRRTLSKSFYKINFQNSTESIDEFCLVPEGYLGWWIDSTQIENVVHIYESEDYARRKAYEADPEWNEYVWLCNRILSDNKTKAELEKIKSKQIPHWSVYKAFKTAKLSINFGQGAKAFSEKLGLPIEKGRAIFGDIHVACPAIKFLQSKVERLLELQGYVQDVFGHIYRGSEAYKVVAYLVQGTGTGSLPKAQLRANYDTLHTWEEELGENPGPLCRTTHDESSGLLKLSLGKVIISQILRELMFNMTQRFSPKFDNIPLRAKLYLSTTTTADKKKYETKDYDKQIIFPTGCF